METEKQEGEQRQLKPPNKEEQKKLAEAALFMSPEPININELTRIMNAPSFSITVKALKDLKKEFNNRDTALEIVELDNTRFVMRVKDSLMPKVSHLALSTDMRKSVLRTLGLIAVKQPIKQSIVVRIIGNKAYEYVKELSENGFIKATKAGSTKLLQTSPKFENYFGKQAEEIKKMSGMAYQSTLKH